MFQRIDPDLDPDHAARAEQRGRMHIDLFVPGDQAEVRVEAAVAAGGRVVFDAEAPDWWTVADPEGNELDIAVSVGARNGGWPPTAGESRWVRAGG